MSPIAQMDNRQREQAEKPAVHRSVKSRVKRGADVFVSLFLLMCLLPLLLVISVLIVLDSWGSPFFSQTRVGWCGGLFRMLKFRSMYLDADSRLEDPVAAEEARVEGRVLKLKHDPRVTRIGRVLRSTSIDELPQLVNVLLGQMSLVGPRALVPSMVDPFPDWAKARGVAKPGITGLWQVSARERNESLADMIDYDLDYIHRWSISLDLAIIARTPAAVLSRKGAI